MQFTAPFKALIRSGAIDLTFRCWRAPRVRVGGIYRIAPDVSVRVTGLANVVKISDADALRAGFPSAKALHDYLSSVRTDGDLALYRVAFERVEALPDPRSRLAAEAPLVDELATLAKRLTAMDGRSNDGAWTRRVLAAISARPGVRAGDLARTVGWDTPRFKVHVRRLKALGLTHSLEVGYRVSVRGQALLTATDDGWQVRARRQTP